MALFRRSTEKPSLWQRIKDVALTNVNVLVQGMDEGSLENLEELLLANDFGVGATLKLVDHVRRLSQRGKIRTETEFLSTVEGDIREILLSGNSGTALRFADQPPTVLMIVGVNGVGKTTTIGKLAHRLQREGHRVLLAAADTFRAGAIEQLDRWAERTGAAFVGAQPGADPASVAYDAVDAAESRRADVVIVDTAGRLHTQENLMEELRKIERVLGRRLSGAPHETLLVLDATIGQNSVAQVRTFGQALTLTGLVLSKLDSTAHGGTVVALKEEFDLPVKLVGTGEDIDALQPFNAAAFAVNVLGA